MSIQLVVFELNNEEFGIDVSAVNSIVRSNKYKIQKLPGIDNSIEGIINLRGRVNYIFNLKAKLKFNFIEMENSSESKFIMLNANRSTIGCIVDEVNDFVKLNDEDVQQAPCFFKNINAKYILGIGKVEDRMIIILNLDELFASEYEYLQKAVANN